MERRSIARTSRIFQSCLQLQQSHCVRLQLYQRLLSTAQQTAAGPQHRSVQQSQSVSPPSSLGLLGASLRMSQDQTQDPSFFAAIPEINSGHTVTPPPHHLHVYSTKHNTHISLTRPDRSPIMVVSTGNLGFKKAARGTYDAAYQLGAYMMKRIRDSGLLTTPPSKEKRIDKLELVLRGFGDGREAIKKILLGSEGMLLRPRISRVTDATRLKFGGTRSKKPRRLG